LDGKADDDLVRDMAGVLTWFCVCLYGRRSAVNRALKAVGCARRGIGPRAVSAGNVVAGGMVVC
jgi:putative resolvase